VNNKRASYGIDDRKHSTTHTHYQHDQNTHTHTHTHDHYCTDPKNINMTNMAELTNLKRLADHHGFSFSGLF